MGSLEHDLAHGRQLLETHISWVFLEADVVWKVKKPVAFGFLDFSSLELRKAACDAEYELNQRLSTNVYLGVVRVCRTADGMHHFGGEGELVDFAVQMHRLPDAARADILLESGQLPKAAVRRIARRIAEFHAGSLNNEAISRFGTAEAIQTNIRENFEQTEAVIGRFLTNSEIDQLRHSQLEFIEQHRELFAERLASSRIRDGHGDLRLEHVYLQSDVNVIDCIEFNERFRYGDVCCDLAFLAMDLSHHGRDDLREVLLAEYAQSTGDYDLYAVVSFYEAYRAMVRGKVACLSPGAPLSATEGTAHAAIRRYFVQAVAAQRPPATRRGVIAVGGLIGSGKSTLATALSDRLACPVVDSDRTRKQLAGVPTSAVLGRESFAGEYAKDATARVYAELLRRAERVLLSGRSVILDASFSSNEFRKAARDLAQRTDATFHFVECLTSREVTLQRLVERARTPGASDARAELYDEFASHFEPVTEFSADEHVHFHAGDDIESLVARQFDGLLGVPTRAPRPGH